MQIKVFQGGERLAEENELLGQFEFSGFRRAPRGDVAIDVTFAINADGIVDVTASDPETGQQASTTLTLSSGLSSRELEQIIDEDKTSRVRAADPLLVPAAPSPPEPQAAAAPYQTGDISELGISGADLEAAELGSSEAIQLEDDGIQFGDDDGIQFGDDEILIDDDEIQIDDEQLLVLADEVVASPDASELASEPPDDGSELFETGQFDLSAGLEEE